MTSAVFTAFLLITTLAPARSVAAPQSAAAPVSVPERLKRIEAELYAGGSHAKDDIRELTDILAANPGIAEAHMLLAVAYRSVGNPEMVGEARAELRQALDLKPDLLPARLFLAQVYLETSRPDRAREELEAALARAPNQPQFLILLGEAERQLGNPAKAIEISRGLLQSDPKLAQAHYYLGLALLDLKQRDEGIRELELVIQSGVGDPNVFLNLGGAYLDAGRVDQALATLEQGARNAPTVLDLRIQLARAYRMKGSLQQAEQQLAVVTKTGFSKQPTVALQQLQTSYHLELGLIRLQQNQFAQAASAFQAALGMDPNSGPAHRYMAEVLMHQGLYSRALEQAVQADKLGSPLPAAQRKELETKLGIKKTGGLE